MPYIDGFIVPATDRDAYQAFETAAAGKLKDCGALRVVQGWGDDVPHGKRTDLYRAVAAEDGETVVFAWVEWPDKATRDAGWQKMMADGPPPGEAPFDMKRMIFGGFDVIVDR